MIEPLCAAFMSSITACAGKELMTDVHRDARVEDSRVTSPIV